MVNARIFVDHRGLDAALRAFKKALDKDGVMGEVKARRHYLKPSEMRKQKQKAARTREAKRQGRQHAQQPRPQARAGRKLTRQIRKGRGRLLAARR